MYCSPRTAIYLFARSFSWHIDAEGMQAGSGGIERGMGIEKQKNNCVKRLDLVGLR